MKRFGMVCAGMAACAGSWAAAADLAAQISGWTVDLHQVPIYGKAYHTNPGAITLTPGGLWETVYTSDNLGAATVDGAFTPVVDTSPKGQDWGSGGPGSKTGDFGVRWEGYVNVPSAGNYSMTMGADDLGAIFVDGKMVYYNRDSHWNGSVALSAGQHSISWQFGEWGGGANYNVNENIAGDTYTAASGHPLAAYVLEYKKTRSDMVSGKLRMETYAGDNFNTYRETRLYTAPVNSTWWGGWGAGAEVWTPSSAEEWGLGNLGQNFSLKLYGEMYFDKAGTQSYAFTGGADDNVILYVDADRNGSFGAGETIYSNWGGTPNNVSLAQGWYPILVTFRDTGGGQSFSVQRDGQYLGNGTALLRSTGTFDDWVEFQRGLTEVGSGASDGLLGTLDLDALGLFPGWYDVRLRVLNTNVEQVVAMAFVEAPEPGMFFLVVAGLSLACSRRRRS